MSFTLVLILIGALLLLVIGINVLQQQKNAQRLSGALNLPVKEQLSMKPKLCYQTQG